MSMDLNSNDEGAAYFDYGDYGPVGDIDLLFPSPPSSEQRYSIHGSDRKQSTEGVQQYCYEGSETSKSRKSSQPGSRVPSVPRFGRRAGGDDMSSDVVPRRGPRRSADIIGSDAVRDERSVDSSAGPPSDLKLPSLPAARRAAPTDERLTFPRTTNANARGASSMPSAQTSGTTTRAPQLTSKPYGVSSSVDLQLGNAHGGVGAGRHSAEPHAASANGNLTRTTGETPGGLQYIGRNGMNADTGAGATSANGNGNGRASSPSGISGDDSSQKSRPNGWVKEQAKLFDALASSADSSIHSSNGRPNGLAAIGGNRGSPSAVTRTTAAPTTQSNGTASSGAAAANTAKLNPHKPTIAPPSTGHRSQLSPDSRDDKDAMGWSWDYELNSGVLAEAEVEAPMPRVTRGPLAVTSDKNTSTGAQTLPPKRITPPLTGNGVQNAVTTATKTGGAVSPPTGRTGAKTTVGSSGVSPQTRRTTTNTATTAAKSAAAGTRTPKPVSRSPLKTTAPVKGTFPPAGVVAATTMTTAAAAAAPPPPLVDRRTAAKRAPAPVSASPAVQTKPAVQVPPLEPASVRTSLDGKLDVLPGSKRIIMNATDTSHLSIDMAMFQNDSLVFSGKGSTADAAANVSGPPYTEQQRAAMMAWADVQVLSFRPHHGVACTAPANAKQRYHFAELGRAPAEMAGEAVEMNYELHNVLLQMRHKDRKMQLAYPTHLPVEVDLTMKTRRPRTPRSFYGKSMPNVGTDWFRHALDSTCWVDSPDIASLEKKEEADRIARGEPANGGRGGGRPLNPDHDAINRGAVQMQAAPH